MHPSNFVPTLHEGGHEGNPAATETSAAPVRQQLLLLEDDIEFARYLKEYLETFGYAVTHVTNGVQGMRKIMAQDFDGVVCDLLMPSLPGDMFYLGVERVKPHLSKRFIFITGHQNNPKVGEFLRKTGALSLFKPFELHVLLETIDVALRERLAA